MALVASPYGLRPIGLLGGRMYAGATSKFKIASGYATNIFYGDVVKTVNDGTIAKDTGTATATPLGIFLGVSYTDPAQKQPIFAQYWPASTVATDAYAYVCDDPWIIFQAQGAATIPQADLFLNAALVQGTGSTGTGNSAVGIGSQNTTNTLPVRIIGFVKSGTSEVGDTYTDVICMWNHGMHHYLQATGT